MDSDVTTIVIVGGGASGTLLTIQLLHTIRAPLSITIVEPRERLGQGIAYSTRSSAHLLNVPASGMSALPDMPHHFVDWMRRWHCAEVEDYAFVPRMVYGRYIEHLLRTTQQEGSQAVTVRHMRDRVCRLAETKAGLRLFSENGSSLIADAVVLAVGNGPPANPLLEKSDVEIANAWDADALAALPKDKGVLVVGSGLTAIDTCLSLDENGHRGPVYMVSRRGLLPRRHLETALNGARGIQATRLLGSPRPLLRSVKRAIARERALGRSWQGVIDELRANTDEIWHGFSLRDKQRFLRHLRPYWEVVRHRMPAQVSRVIEAMQSRGQLHVIRGRLKGASTETTDELCVQVERQNPRREMTLRVARIVNCTGSRNDPRNSADPLLRQIVAEGIGLPHPTSLGLETTKRGALIRGDGTSWSNLFALGPIRRGALWETTAMPEIRRQAAELASELAISFSPSGQPG